mgnify:CR=1 FL=1
MQKINLLYGSLLLIMLSACTETVKQDGRPDWIDKPEPYFVGKCTSDVLDLAAQEQCAYNEGLAYMATSKDVSLQRASDPMIKQAVSENSADSDGQESSLVNTEEKDTRGSGSIIDKWHDKTAHIMYVLIKEN